jgi:hypothetical protein
MQAAWLQLVEKFKLNRYHGITIQVTKYMALKLATHYVALSVALNVALNVATHLGTLALSLLSLPLSRALLPPLRPRATPAATRPRYSRLLSPATQSRYSRLLSPTLAAYSRLYARLATSAAPPALRSSGLL